MIKEDKPVQPSRNFGFRKSHAGMWAHLNIASLTKFADLTKSANAPSPRLRPVNSRVNRTISRLFGPASAGEPSEAGSASDFEEAWSWACDVCGPPKYTAAEKAFTT
jgi:hypothetical protein